VGLNNNEYQIERGKRLNEQAGLSPLCSFIKADFMKVGDTHKSVCLF
jgi:sterol 24-C-methyltransferase